MTPATALTISVMYLTLLQSTESLQRSFLAKKATPANYVFLENLLFESEAASAVDCVSSCWKRPGCWSFTVTTTSLGTTCRGHAVWMTSASSGVRTADTNLWHLNWLERECSNNTECGVPLSECFAGKCLCSPGYYYSNSKESCIEGCAEADLQSTFLVYPGYRIVDNNIGGCPAVPRATDCLDLCRPDPQARSCDHLSANGIWRCCLQALTKMDVPESWDVFETSTHYQKTCV